MASRKMQAIAEGFNLPSSRIRSNINGGIQNPKTLKDDPISNSHLKRKTMGKLVKVKSLGLLHKQLKRSDSKSSLTPTTEDSS